MAKTSSKKMQRKDDTKDNLVKGALITAGAIGAAALVTKAVNDNPDLKDQIKDKANDIRERLEGEAEKVKDEAKSK